MAAGLVSTAFLGYLHLTDRVTHPQAECVPSLTTLAPCMAILAHTNLFHPVSLSQAPPRVARNPSTTRHRCLPSCHARAVRIAAAGSRGGVNGTWGGGYSSAAFSLATLASKGFSLLDGETAHVATVKVGALGLLPREHRPDPAILQVPASPHRLLSGG